MGAMTATVEPAGLPPGRALTVADLEAMPDDGHRYELLDGALIVSPAPGRSHQRVVVRLTVLLDSLTPPDVEVLVAPFAVRPQGHSPRSEQRTELQPDVLVALDADLTERDLPVPPLLAVEVLSPSTRLIDLNLKKAAYERMGAASYWVVDPVSAELWVFELGDDGAYRLVAHVTGDETFAAQLPFPVTIRPADLLSPPSHR